MRINRPQVSLKNMTDDEKKRHHARLAMESRNRKFQNMDAALQREYLVMKKAYHHDYYTRVTLPKRNERRRNNG